MKTYNYCVLGAGAMGRAAAYDLIRQPDSGSVLIADKDDDRLEAAKETLNDNRIQTRTINAEDVKQVEEVLKGRDAGIAAMHYGLNLNITKAAIRVRTNLCDLGGNDLVVDEQLKLSQSASEAGISIIPDCGLAPGLVSMFVKWGVEKFDWVDTVKIRVGGLPQKPEGELKYGIVFSVDGLINEYTEPVRVLRNGEIKTIEPLTEIEEIKFPDVGSGHDQTLLEAFTTSGGASTLISSYRGRLRNLDYKTIRHQGHCDLIRAIYKNGTLTKSHLEEILPVCREDVVLVKVIFEGNSKRHELIMVEKAKPPFTAMMRTTAFPASIISQMQAKGQVTKIGVQPQELCVPSNIFINELSKRGISVKGI